MNTRSRLKFSFPLSQNHVKHIPYPFSGALRPPPYPLFVELGTRTYEDWWSRVLREESLDNHLWAIHVLEMLVTWWPEKREVADKLAYLHSHTHHLSSPLAYYRLISWLELKHGMDSTFQPARTDDNVERMVILREHIKAYLKDHKIEKAVLVDMGASQGDTTFQWAELPAVSLCFGVEINSVYSRIAGHYYKHHKTQYIKADAESLPIAVSCADVVVLSAILEHVKDPEALMAEAERVAKPGALIVVQVPYGGFEHHDPTAQAAFFFDHVRTYDIVGLLLGKKEPVLHYIDGQGNPLLSYGQYDRGGDFVGSYVRE